MSSVFTRIIEGELPGRFVWKDEQVVAFLSIAPITAGHVLVVPRREIDHWIDLPPELLEHLMRVSRAIGQALAAAYRPAKVGLMIAGLEVGHVHLHVLPINGEGDLNFAHADPDAAPAALDQAAETTRAALAGLGFSEAAIG